MAQGDGGRAVGEHPIPIPAVHVLVGQGHAKVWRLLPAPGRSLHLQGQEDGSGFFHDFGPGFAEGLLSQGVGENPAADGFGRYCRSLCAGVGLADFIGDPGGEPQCTAGSSILQGEPGDPLPEFHLPELSADVAVAEGQDEGKGVFSTGSRRIHGDHRDPQVSGLPG